MRAAGQVEPARAPGRNWVLAIYVVALIELVGGLYWALNTWAEPMDLGFGAVLDTRPYAIGIAIGTVAAAMLLLAFAIIELVGRSVLASEEAVARAGAVEVAIDDLIDSQSTPRPMMRAG